MGNFRTFSISLYLAICIAREYSKFYNVRFSRNFLATERGWEISRKFVKTMTNETTEFREILKIQRIFTVDVFSFEYLLISLRILYLYVREVPHAVLDLLAQVSN